MHDRDTRCDDLMLCSSIVEGERCKAEGSCKQTKADANKTQVAGQAVDQRSKNRPTAAATVLGSGLGLIRLAGL